MREGKYTANQLLGIHCHDWAKKPSVRRVRETVVTAKELDSAGAYGSIGPQLREMYTGIQLAKDHASVIHQNFEKKTKDHSEDFEYGSKISRYPTISIESRPVLTDISYGAEIVDGKVIHFVEGSYGKPKFSIPTSTQPIADDFLKLSGDFAIISDLHVPYHSAKTIEKFLETAYSQNIRRFIINGDMNDCGQFHPKRGDLQHHNHRYQDDLDLNKVIYTEFMKCFPEGGYVLSGNHDFWFVQNMKGELDTDWTYSKFFHEFPLIKFSNFEQCQVTSADKVFRLLHGANYSATNPLSVVQKLSAKFECGIVAGHQHLSCSGHSYSGKYQTVCLGGAYSLDRLSYLHHSPKCNPCPTNGFALLKDGFVQNFDNQEWFK